MKNRYLYFASAVVALMAAACNEEPFSDGGEGNIILRTSVNTDMQVVTRTANDAELSQSLMVWISNSKGLVRRYNTIDEIPSRINLVADHYVAEGWAGDSASASFDQIWFKGVKEFDVKGGETATVNLECKVANVAVSVTYDENVTKALADPVMVVGHKAGSLTFAGEDASKRGYFMMPSFDKNLNYELKGIQLNGEEFSFNGTIENAKPGTEYILNVICKEQSNEVGGAIFTIVIDENEIQMSHDINIVAAPKIQGYDFDINKGILAPVGMVGRRSVYVSSATKLSQIILESNLFSGYTFLNGNNNFNLLGMSESIENSLNEKGINFKNNYNEENDETLFQLNLEKSFTDILDNGKYEIKIKAVDVNNRTSEAIIKINVSDAPVSTGTVDMETVSFTTAVLSGFVEKEDVESVGFKYKEAKSNSWNYIEGHSKSRSFEKGSEFIAELTGLKSGTEYEFYAVSGDFESQDIVTFSTKAHLQLPNASFEEWSKEGKAYFPGSNYATTFWDTGNHGSTTLGTSYNITTESSDYVHDGRSSVSMKSRYIMVKFAAGNVFAGKYLATEGTDGVTGFGRPFADKPTSVKMWVKYTPGTKNHRSDKTKFLTNNDEGQIYIALTDDTMDEYKGEKWPFIVNTKTAKYFDKNDARVIAYGEKIFTEATEGEGLIELEIKLDYKRDEMPSNIIFVASSSRYGDYFEGFDDSTMYLDDIELIYED